MEAIILAGGFGTRLQSVIADVPKPMAPVGGKPFLAYLFDYLFKYNVDRVILATGYMHEKIKDYFGDRYRGIILDYSIEYEPLGTGGAIKKALERATVQDILILNGDTFFNVNLNDLYNKHLVINADLTLSLKPMDNFERYGNVVIEGEKVVRFEEKKFTPFGYINGGVYMAKKNLFSEIVLPDKFSFETDFLTQHLERLKIAAYKSENYFIDIGIPADYARAQSELISLYEK